VRAQYFGLCELQQAVGPYQEELESYLIASNLSDVTKCPDRKPFRLGQVQSPEPHSNDCQRGMFIGSRHVNELQRAMFLIISRADHKNLADKMFETFGQRKIKFASLYYAARR
jgi:hypothetical protein